MGGVPDPLVPGRNDFLKAAIPPVQVQVIVFKEIIPYIDIWKSVIIQVADPEAQPVSGFPLVDAGLYADIRETAPVVPVQPVPGKRVRDTPLGTLAIRAVRVDGLVQEEEVQVPVQVLVKKGRLGGEA